MDKIYNEDCLNTMKRFKDNTLDLTVTSPPYDGLRTYNGYSFDFENIAKELYRTTKEGGVVVWIVGDATIKGSESGTSFKQALYFKECGFNLHDTMIYEKINPVPYNGNRYQSCFEYMFILSKGEPKTFNPLIIDCKYAGRLESDKKKYYTKNGSEIINKRKEISKTKKERNIWRFSVGNAAIKDRRNNTMKHPAIFPEQLANDHIISWSNEGDLIYDPFMGSGTTAKMAKLNNRNYIGSEISSEYCKIIDERLNNAVDLFNKA